MLYVVATMVGGLQECPDITYKDSQHIEANSPEEAEKIYNEKHNCSFFYGKCLGFAPEENKNAVNHNKNNSWGMRRLV